MTSIQIPHQRTSPDQEAAPAAPVSADVELRWGPLLRRTAARAGLTVVASLVLWSVLPALLGWAPQVILSGSMEPRIHSGDVIVTREVPADKISKGKVITTQDPDDPAKTRTHRVVRRSADGTIVTKGDANRQADSSPVKDADVIGMGVIRVPFVGRPAYWMVERNYAALGVTLLLLGWCAVSAFPGRVKPDGDEADDSDDARPGPRSASDSRRDRRLRISARRRRLAAGAVAMSVVAVGALGAPANAVFKKLTLNPASTLKAASTFYPYRTEVLGDSPYLFWRVNEASGVAMNDAGAGNKDGTLLGQTYALGQAGALAAEPRDKALGLTVGVINANNTITAPGTFSVEAWVKTTSNSGGRILGFGNGTGMNPSSTVDRHLYLAPSGKVMFGVGSTKKTVASAGTVNNGAWHHVVGTYTTGTNGMKLYVDGTLQNSTLASPISMTGIWRAGADQMTGWTGNPTDFFYEGNLDEIAVYTDVLTLTEVQSHYNIGRTP